MMGKKRLINPLLIKTFIIGLVLIVFQMSWGNQAHAKSQEIIILTDKKEYKEGEIVKITLKNGLSGNIFSHAASQTPVFSIDSFERKNSEGNWSKLFAQCQYPNCVYDIGFPAQIKPSQTVTFKWNPLIYIDGTNKHIQAKSGIYRLLIIYQIRKDDSSQNWKWLKAYSNEFTIK